MMKYDIIVTGYPQALKVVQNLKHNIEHGTQEIAFGALNEAALVWQQNFVSEGIMVGGWMALAQKTIEERERLGFPGEHPILIRYGHLKMVTTDALIAATRPTTIAKTDSQGKQAGVVIGANQGSVNVRAIGDKARNQGARPYWFVNSAVQQRARDGALGKVKDIVERSI